MFILLSVMQANTVRHNANLDRRNSSQLEPSFELQASAMSHIVKLPKIFLCFSSGMLVICFLFWLVVTPEAGPVLFNCYIVQTPAQK